MLYCSACRRIKDDFLSQSLNTGNKWNMCLFSSLLAVLYNYRSVDNVDSALLYPFIRYLLVIF